MFSFFDNTSEDFLRRIHQSNAAFINSLPDGFELLELVYDKQGNFEDFVFLEVNTAYEKQFGREAVDLIGKRKKSVVPTVEQRWYDYALEAAKTGKTLSYQYHNPATNGYYDTQFIPIPPNQIAVLFKDITKSKEAEKALTQTKKNLHDVIMQSPVACSIFDQKGLLVQVNDAWVKQWQIPPELVMGKYNVLESKQVSDTGLLPVVQRAFKGEIIRSYNLEFDASLEPQTMGHGRKRWISTTAYPIKNESGGLSIVVLTEDISERINSEETLRKSEQRYRELYESFDEAFIVIDWELTVTNWNKAAERVTTVLAKDALGKKVYEVLPEMLSVDYTPYFDSLKEKKPTRFLMNVVSRQTKKPSVFEVSTYPSELGITIIVQDKTDVEEAKRLSAIGATAGMVGHDIRNPLQAVLSETYLLKEDLKAMPNNETKKDVTESLDGIENNVLYINKIVQDLQDYARPITPEISEANLTDIFANIFKNITIPDSIKLSLGIKGLEKVKTDPMLLQRALTNLVTNAVQAMPNGGELKIQGQISNGRVVVTVADTGVGIPDEAKPRLFTPMMTTKAKGQGFGLAVSKRLVEALKGNITFESVRGKGTEFRVELPP